MRPQKLPILLLFILFSCYTKEFRRNPITIEDRIHDEVGLLTETEKKNLFILIDSIDQFGPEVAICIIDTLDGQPIEIFSLNKAQSLKLGRPGLNDGLLITLAFKDRRVRIEVGSGLERIVKDEIALEIITNDLVPEFKSGNYYQGFYASVETIKKLLEEHAELIGQEP